MTQKFLGHNNFIDGYLQCTLIERPAPSPPTLQVLQLRADLTLLQTTTAKNNPLPPADLDTSLNSVSGLLHSLLYASFAVLCQFLLSFLWLLSCTSKTSPVDPAQSNMSEIHFKCIEFKRITPFQVAEGAWLGVALDGSFILARICS